jgi:hypothetical protein
MPWCKGKQKLLSNRWGTSPCSRTERTGFKSQLTADPWFTFCVAFGTLLSPLSFTIVNCNVKTETSHSQKSLWELDSIILAKYLRPWAARGIWVWLRGWGTWQGGEVWNQTQRKCVCQTQARLKAWGIWKEGSEMRLRWRESVTQANREPLEAFQWGVTCSDLRRHVKMVWSVKEVWYHWLQQCQGVKWEGIVEETC